MNNEIVILPIKSKDYLTANKPTPYARRRGYAMSADNAAEFGNVPQSDADRKIGSGEKQPGKFESFLAFLFKKKKAAKEWEEALKKELKGKTVDKEKLEEFIKKGIGPQEGLKMLLPSDIKEIPKIINKEGADEQWEEKKKAEQIPDEVVERMKQEQLPPEALVKFGEEYISSYELEMVEAVLQGFSNKSFDAISDDEKAKIVARIAQGQSPLTAVVEAIVSGEVNSEPEEEISEDDRAVIKELEQAHVQALLVEEAGEEMGAAVVEEEQEVIIENEETSTTTVSEKQALQEQVGEEQEEEIFAAWEEALEADWENEDTKRTARMLSKLGVRPEQSRQGEDTPTAQEVVENARIAEEQEAQAEELRSQNDKSLKAEIDALEDEAKQARFAKAEELLELPVIEEMPEDEQGAEKERRIQMKQGLWEAHSYGKGEEGKFGGEAGIYNYTVKQLLNKRRILVDAGYTKEQASKLIEWGVAGNVTIDPTLYDPDTFTDPRAQELARYVQQRARDGGTVVSDRVLRNAGEMAQEIERKNVIEGIATPEDVRNMASRVLEDAQRGGTDDEAIRRNLQLHLMGPEMDLLGRDPNGEGAMEWLNGEFDTIYQGSSQGQELDSPTLQELQRKVAYAIAYLNYTFPDRRDIAERFFAAFSIRQNFMPSPL